MSVRKMFVCLVLVLGFGFAPIASAGDDCSTPVSTKADIVDTAVNAGSFDTLVAAVKAAGLVNALKGEGPFTVFAPTDEAFAKLPKGTLETLLKPESKKTLTGILTYHVLPGRFDAKRVVSSSGAVTLQGQRADFSTNDKGAMIDGARIVTTDIQCSNGVIHVIDAVILPSANDIVATAKSAKMFNTLLTAAMKAGLAETLQKDGPFTVFAPTDDAFAKLPEGTIASLLQPENREKLASILKFHVVSGRVYSDQALKAGTAKTLFGAPISIRVVDGKAKVQDANLVKTDIDASNGVIHVIDSVILPPAKATASRN